MARPIHTAEYTSIEDGASHPGTAIMCHASFDIERKKWRAWDETGNEAFSDWKHLAMLEVFAKRLIPGGFAIEKTAKIVEVATRIGQHLRDQNGVNAVHLDELEEVTRV